MYNFSRKGGFPFKIAKCYKKLNKKEHALYYYIQSAVIRKERIVLEDQATEEAVSNALRLAKELGTEGELPNWINRIKFILKTIYYLNFF